MFDDMGNLFNGKVLGNRDLMKYRGHGCMSRDELREKSKKQIIFVSVIGMILVISDLFVTGRGDGISLKDSGNRLYMERPEEGGDREHGYLRVKIHDEKKVFEKKIAIYVDPYEKDSEKANENKEVEPEMTEEDRINREIRSIVNNFNEDTASKSIELPASLESGETLSWEKENSNNTILIISLTLFSIILVYKSRFKPLEKKRKEEYESVIRQLPEFVNRLILLLNAGMVLNSAFEKSVKESMSFKTREKDFFYTKMRDIYMTVINTNGSMYKEFRIFAKTSGIKELMRISNIINDNVHKGVELTQKLQDESEILWTGRKKNCEERGKSAETKLTFPLMIFLIVLIVITIMPALLEL